MSAPVIQMRDLAFGWPDGPLLFQGLDLTIAAGEVVALSGPNGAGKSSLLRLVTGLSRPTRGQVLVAGADPAALSAPEIARRVGAVMQVSDRQILTGRAIDEVELVARTLGLPEPERRAEEALARVGLAAQRNTHPLDLHAGARRLLALAAAIARRPPILLLDEAQRALDDHSRRRLSEITAIEADRGAAIVIVSHDRRFLESLATREVTLGPDLPESPRAVP